MDHRPGSPRPVKALAALLCAALLGSACDPKPGTVPSDVSIYFTCDTRGRLEPCGCFVGQFGGLTRLKTVLDAERAGESLRVDVGDAIGGREDYDVIQYEYMLRAFAALKYDALNAGHREAQLSAAELHRIAKTSPVPILSANLLDAETRQPVFAPHRIVERAGLRIAIIGVMDSRGLADPPGNGLMIESMAAALARSIAEVKSRSDFIVLLAFADETALAELAQQFYEVHAILGGKVRQPSQELRKENRSLIYYVTNEARVLGILRLRLLRGQPMEVLGKEIRFLHDKIPQAPEFVELANAYRETIRQTRLAIDDPHSRAADSIPGTRAAAAYVGTARCVSCHATAATVWEKSAHSHAFTTLAERRADADPKCIGCHTVGFGNPSGYLREFGPDRLTHVGCESCHGPGSLHVQLKEGDDTIDFRYRPLDAGDCQKCHYGEFSRPFDWNEFWPPIRHGQEPGATAAN